MASAFLTMAASTGFGVPIRGKQYNSWTTNEGETSDMAPPNPHLRVTRGKEGFAQALEFRMAGIYYIWMRVTSRSDLPETITYEIDGKQPLRGDKAILLVPPHARSLWLSFTRHRRFKAQVHVDRPGRHTVTIRPRKAGGKPADIAIEAVALTLANLAVPSTGALDESMDQSALKWSPYRRGPKAPVAGVDGWRGNEPIQAVRVSRTAYYIDAERGSDTHTGNSPVRAWKTLTRANAQKLGPGDALLLACGGKWEGTLAPRGGGKPGNPVTIGSYGKGARPCIDGGGGPGVRIAGLSHWTIQDLQVTNDGGGSAHGINVESGAGSQPRGITIRRCFVEGAGGCGIAIGPPSEGANDGYADVTVEDCLVRWCNGTGVVVSGSRQDGCKDTVIRRCTAYGNGFSGMMIHSGENGLIERCLAYNNGWMSGGTVGIWCWNARNVTIRHCESYRTMYFDGAGFDIDWSCMGCTIEYCYSHDNDGEGYLLMGSGTAKFRDYPMETGYCLARYNISESDGLRGGGAGFVMCETFIDSFVHNNTVVSWSKGDKPEAGGGFVMNGWELTEMWWNGKNTSGGWPERTVLLNNIAVSAHEALPALNADAGSTKGGNLLDYNLYAGKGKPLIRWAGKGAIRLEEFRKLSGQESWGKMAEPGLPEPLAGKPGRLPMDRLRPGKSSPAAAAGTRVALDDAWRKARLAMLGNASPRPEIPLDVAEAVEDFTGRPLRAGRPPSIGALEP